MSNENRISHVKTSQREPGREQRIITIKATQLVWLLFGIIEAIIALRVILKMVGANPESPIVAMLYGFTYLFLYPFTGLIGSPTVGNLVLDLSSLFAMLIYALIAWALARIVWLIFYLPPGPVVAVTETDTSEQHTTP